MSELQDCYRALKHISKSLVQKNKGNMSPKVAWSVAITKASETPAGAILAKRIIQLQNQRAMRAQYAPFLKNMPEVNGDLTDDRTFDRYQEAARSRAQNEDDDDWSKEFEAIDEDDLVEELERTKQREAKLREMIREIREA